MLIHVLNSICTSKSHTVFPCLPKTDSTHWGIRHPNVTLWIGLHNKYFKDRLLIRKAMYTYTVSVEYLSQKWLSLRKIHFFIQFQHKCAT